MEKCPEKCPNDVQFTHSSEAIVQSIVYRYWFLLFGVQQFFGYIGERSE